MDATISGKLIKQYAYMLNVYSEPGEKTPDKFSSDKYLMLKDPIFEILRAMTAISRDGKLIEDEIIARVNFPNHSRKKYRDKWTETTVKKTKKQPLIARYSMVGKRGYGYIDNNATFATLDWMRAFEAEDGMPVRVTIGNMGSNAELREPSRFHNYIQPRINFLSDIFSI